MQLSINISSTYKQLSKIYIIVERMQILKKYQELVNLGESIYVFIILLFPQFCDLKILKQKIGGLKPDNLGIYPPWLCLLGKFLS